MEKKKPKKKRAKNWLTENEMKSLFEIENLSDRDDLILTLLYGCALRVNELCRIRVSDIIEEENKLVIRNSKNEPTPNAVPLYGRAMEKTLTFIEKHNREYEDYLFPSRSENGMNRKSIFRIVRRLAKEAGIKKEVGTHTFRRSRATHLLDKGMEMVRVSQLLRHKNLTTTMAYLKLSSNILRKEMEQHDWLT